MSELSVEELARRLEAGDDLTVVDIREAADYADWNIPGSRNLPVYDALRGGRTAPLVERAGELPKSRALVTVCHGGVVSRTAAALLRELGYNAVSLSGGMYEWGGVWSEIPVRGRLAPGTTFLQVQRLGKGCLSYVLGSRGQGVIVDPSVDLSAYTGLAHREGLRITHVLETHVHADHVSRARALCELTGATLVMPPNDRVRFAFTPLADGATLRAGDSQIEAVATPGHTGESTCYLVDGVVLLTGDTLFLDAVGRPDLERGDAGAESGARSLHRSLRRLADERFRDVWIYPAHHGQPLPFDRRPIEARLSDVTARLELLRADESGFVSRVVASLGVKPPNHASILTVNEGRGSLGEHSPLDLEAGPNRCAAG